MAWLNDLFLKYRTIAAASLPMPRRAGTNFTGAGVAITDDAANDQTIVTISGGTDTPGGPAGGDLSGTYPNPTVAQVNGATIPVASTVGEVLRVTGSNALGYGAVNLANPVSVTGVLPKANQGVQDMAGDVTGSTAVSVVAKVHGSTVPVGGALTTGQALLVTGASSLGYGPINLANSNAVTGTLPSASGGGGYVTAMDLDFAAQTTQSLATDTNYTIGGFTFTKINSANDSVAMAITNTAGLVQKPGSSSNLSGSTRTAPALYITLANAGVPSPYPGMKIRIWGYIASQNIAANFDSAFFGFEAGNSQLLQYYAYKQWASALNFGAGITLNSGTTNTAGDTTTTTDNVLVVESEIGAPGFRTYTGVWSSGWPTAASLRIRDSIQLTGAQALHVAGTSVWDVILAAGRAASGTALNITWGNLKVDYKP